MVGRGVYYGSAATEATACSDHDVVIVGGANSAGQAAVYFARYARQLTMVVRGPSLTASMSSYLIDQIETTHNIEVRTNTSVLKCEGQDHLQCVTLVDNRDGSQVAINTEHLFIFIGAAPLTDWLPSDIVRDRQGFVVTGPDLVHGDLRPDGWELERDPYLLESSIPGVFAAGDVRASSVKRVASAVGEGALAVTLVHRYLAEQ
jgi:thioredoxin reductase (NADPH)